jgi:thiol-disulfide isomerase/thioredoxin
MKTYFLSLLVVGLCLTSQSLLAQETPAGNKSDKPNAPKTVASPTPKPSPTPIVNPAMSFMEQPDYKAYSAGIRERDPVKQVTLLEKYMADFPNSAFISSANEILLAAIVKAYPNDKERIRAQAQKTLAGIREDMVQFTGLSSVSRTYNSVIDSFYNAGLTEEAQETALKAFKFFDETNAKQLFAAKAPILILQGKEALKNGDLKKAEQNFKLATAGEYEGNTALLGLADVAEKRNKNKILLDYLIQADARGSLKKDYRNKLEEIYVKVKGSNKGLSELLDENYRKANPLPVTVVKYTPTEKRTKRTVLAELFTGSACAPCVTADLAFDALIQRYNPSEIAVMVYHLHIPGPDPMTNPATVARSKYYGGFGTPTYFLNGADKQTGGGAIRKQTSVFYNRITPKIDAELEKEQEADINLSALIENQVIKANVAYDGLKGDAQNLKLNIALVEHEISYMGENGIRFHQMVVRDFGGDKREGFMLKDKSGKVEWQFDLQKLSAELKDYLDKYEVDTQKDRPDFAFSEKKHILDSKNLAVVAFIQDEKTKKILQSTFFDLVPTKK